jgi:hypothetical protein
MLELMYGRLFNSQVMMENISSWQVSTFYAIPQDLYNWIGQKFPDCRFRHQYSLSVQNLASPSSTGTLVIDFRTEEFSVIVAKDNKLLLFQTYSYSSPEDVIYYLLKICEQFQLTQELVEIKLSGLIDRNSALYKDLYQYFLHVEFRHSTWSNKNDVYPEHFFTSLNDLAKCAS